MIHRYQLKQYQLKPTRNKNKSRQEGMYNHAKIVFGTISIKTHEMSSSIKKKKNNNNKKNGPFYQ